LWTKTPLDKNVKVTDSQLGGVKLIPFIFAAILVLRLSGKTLCLEKKGFPAEPALVMEKVEKMERMKNDYKDTEKLQEKVKALRTR